MLPRPNELTFFHNEMNYDFAKSIQGFDAICGFVNDDFSYRVIEQLAEKEIKLIALRCAGFDNVDLKACQQFGIKVVRVPSYSPSAIAEHAIGLLMCLNRKIHRAYIRTRDGNFSLDGLTGVTLRGKTIGIFGIGKIGQCFAQICKGLGMEILIYDKWQPPQSLLDEFGATYVDQETLFRKSDILSLHCPLTKETQHIINKQSLDMMKNTIVIINTSRGALINTEDIIEELRQKRVAGLAIDVYENEKSLFFSDHSGKVLTDQNLMMLQSFPNVIITAHQAFLTEEALQQICKVTLENIQNIKDGEECPNEVTIKQ
ncbi:hypothetical protein PPERSA_04136 [Pseudocohnilembus persalinus]|uniref:D-isomer specific 2-hydroxyacid dehydrogenase, NAD-binding n=1 Tax=Pseudocohnilembus persalinus TaxID=266149 RepID=A0A0V0QNP0_PSEPJ|nr:hypothetical protein PPERSA_04136 [Pseudocohnilembus persalinus]|eukprot:KRX03584.1 hypothetical protein PPERSA_04136 [Pseudocohnilembus persalinus]